MFLRFSTFVVFLLMSSSAFADQWTVNRLRGEAQQYDGREWHALAIGDTLDNGHHVRTLHHARMELVRGDEVIELGAATFLAIHEAGGRKMTTVEQHLGSVRISADKRDIEHFAVETPMLAAVVKGTEFTVSISRNRTIVDVDSGVVQVQDNQSSMMADVVAGQTASASEGAPLGVSGPGSANTIFIVNGQQVVGSAAAAQAAGFTPSPPVVETQSNNSSFQDSGNQSSSPSGGTPAPSGAQPQPVPVPQPQPQPQPDTGVNPQPQPEPNPQPDPQPQPDPDLGHGNEDGDDDHDHGHGNDNRDEDEGDHDQGHGNDDRDEDEDDHDQGHGNDDDDDDGDDEDEDED